MLLDAAGANENAPGAVAGAFELDALSAPDAVRPINPGVVVVDACFGGVAEGGSGPQLNELADARAPVLGLSATADECARDEPCRLEPRATAVGDESAFEMVAATGCANWKDGMALNVRAGGPPFIAGCAEPAGAGGAPKESAGAGAEGAAGAGAACGPKEKPDGAGFVPACPNSDGGGAAGATVVASLAGFGATGGADDEEKSVLGAPPLLAPRGENSEPPVGAAAGLGAAKDEAGVDEPGWPNSALDGVSEKPPFVEAASAGDGDGVARTVGRSGGGDSARGGDGGGGGVQRRGRGRRSPLIGPEAKALCSSATGLEAGAPLEAAHAERFTSGSVARRARSARLSTPVDRSAESAALAVAAALAGGWTARVSVALAAVGLAADRSSASSSARNDVR